MKKLYLLTLPLMMISLTGCKKEGVTYKEVDDISMYYTEEKIDASKASAGQLNIGIMASTQTGGGVDYQMKRTIDLNYCYEYSKTVDDNTTIVGKELYFPNFEDTDSAISYQVTTTNGEASLESKSGEYVNEQYNSHLSTFRKLVTNFIDNPLYTAKLYIAGNPYNLMWYKGSDGTLKVTCTDENETIHVSTIIDAKTLYVKKTSLSLDGYGSFSYGFSYPKTVKHLAPKDIGYNL